MNFKKAKVVLTSKTTNDYKEKTLIAVDDEDDLERVGKDLKQSGQKTKVCYLRSLEEIKELLKGNPPIVAMLVPIR